jgi:hypothetical protein
MEPELSDYKWTDDDRVVVMNDGGPEAVLRATEERINAGGWDQRPKICIVSGNENMAAVEEIQVPDEVTDNFFVGFPTFVSVMSELIWENRRQKTFPGLIQHIRDNILGPSFYGVLVTFEGWAVSEPDPIKEPEKWADFVVAAVTAGGLSTHPDRVETRWTIMMAANKQAIGIMRRRDQGIEYRDNINNPKNPVLRAMMTFLGSLLALMIHKGLTNDEIFKHWGLSAQEGEGE